MVGVDATNLRRGGGRTHLIELLRDANPLAFGIDRVVVWGGRDTLNLLVDKPWLDKRCPPSLDGNLVQRSWWQRNALSNVARAEGVDVLFVPGGNYAGDFHPVVTMSRNMLPFEWGVTVVWFVVVGLEIDFLAYYSIAYVFLFRWNCIFDALC